MIRRILIIIMSTIMLFNISGCKKNSSNPSNANGRTIVAVSIVPQETFVKAVAGDLVDVVTMIPQGYSPTNYQPSPSQMVAFSDAKVYFSIGVAAEASYILDKIDELNDGMRIISLADKVGKVYPHRQFEDDIEEEEHDDHTGLDPHIWLSPKRVKIMIEVIEEELIALNPENRSVYEANAKAYMDRLEDIDNRIKNTLSGLDEQSFIIYHPSFGYFADDYGLNMVTIEESGKQATVKRLQEVIDFAKQKEIKVIFYQEEFDSNQAKTIAKEIGGVAVQVEPLDPNYIENMQSIVDGLIDVLK